MKNNWGYHLSLHRGVSRKSPTGGPSESLILAPWSKLKNVFFPEAPACAWMPAKGPRSWNKGGGRPNLRTKRTLAPVGTEGFWRGCAPSEVEKKLIFKVNSHDLVHSFEAPTQSETTHLCKKWGRGRRLRPLWIHPSLFWFTLLSFLFSLICSLSFSFLFHFFLFFLSLSSFPFLFLLFWRPFSDPGGRGPQSPQDTPLLPMGRVSRQSQRVRGWVQPFTDFEILSRHFERYLHTMKLKLI